MRGQSTDLPLRLISLDVLRAVKRNLRETCAPCRCLNNRESSRPASDTIGEARRRRHEREHDVSLCSWQRFFTTPADYVRASAILLPYDFTLDKRRKICHVCLLLATGEPQTIRFVLAR